MSPDFAIVSEEDRYEQRQAAMLAWRTEQAEKAKVELEHAPKYDRSTEEYNAMLQEAAIEGSRIRAAVAAEKALIAKEKADKLSAATTQPPSAFRDWE